MEAGLIWFGLVRFCLVVEAFVFRWGDWLFPLGLCTLYFVIWSEDDTILSVVENRDGMLLLVV